MTHPLTDEMCYDMELGYSFPDRMRAAYDKGADWQLKQVIEWLKAAISDQCIWPHQIDALPRRLQKAMRPREDDS